ncbi:MAG: tyrosine-type recombinase/integrase [Candidatus Promineifilaceae bacterium]
MDRRIINVSPGTIEFYRKKLKVFVNWCYQKELVDVLQITPNHLRLFLGHLEDTNHNPGGCSTFYESIRAFFYFFEEDLEPENWKNPIKKVSAPKVPNRPLEPVSIDDVSKLLETCDGSTICGSRDRAIFLVLLDTGVRAPELVGIDLEDLNPVDGSIQIKKGKGGKVRTVIIGKKARKSIRFFLRRRPKFSGPLFTKRNGRELSYSALQAILGRRSAAGVSGVSLHDFRRAFCLAQLQARVPETSIARFMVHSNTQLIGLYARQTTRDLIEVFHSVLDSEL